MDLGNRILLNTGISIVDDDIAVQYLLDTGEIPDHIRVVKSSDSISYKQKYLVDISHALEDGHITPDTTFSEEEYDGVLHKIYNTRRIGYDSEAHDYRFTEELDYFERNGHQHLIIKLYRLIQSFRDDGIVWGVGRGSACASYIFYLIGVHDIDSILYKLEFKDFSKENK